MPSFSPSARSVVVAVMLLAALPAVLPGVVEAIESASLGGDCSRFCAGDGPDGDCSSSCTDCTCCQRAMSALLTFDPAQGSPAGIDGTFPIAPESLPLEIVAGIFHPPRS